MLARANRVITPADFRTAVRRGRRVTTEHSVLYMLARDSALPTRFGFIVAKNVGGAVTRNLVRRRLRAIGHGLLPRHSRGSDIVVRALPGVEGVSWSTLQGEITEGVDKGLAPR